MAVIFAWDVFSRGGVLAEFNKYLNSKYKGNDEKYESIEVPNGYEINGFIATPIEKGLINFVDLIDGKISFKAFFEAKKMADYLLYIDAKKQEIIDCKSGHRQNNDLFKGVFD